MKSNSAIEKLFAPENDLPFTLLLIGLIFKSFRPDRLIPGGEVALYFPVGILLLLLICWIKSPHKKLDNRQTKTYLLFVALMVIHMPFVRNFGFTWGVIKSTLIYGVTFFLFKIQFINNYYKLNRYLKLYIGLATFFAIIGLTGKGRVLIPALGDENDFSLLMNTLIPFAYFFAQETRENYKKIFWYTAFGIFVLANVASFSRGGFVGLTAVGVFIFVKSQKKIATIGILAIVAVSTVLFAPERYWQEMESIITVRADSGTGQQRVESWKAGWRMFLDHPVIGVGPNNYGPWVTDYYQHYGSRTPKTMWGRVAHSLYFTLIPEMGIVGVCLFLSILYSNFKDHRYLSRVARNITTQLKDLSIDVESSKMIEKKFQFFHYTSTALLGAMVAYLVTGIFISVLWYTYFWNITAFWIITANVARDLESKILKMRNT